MITLEANTPKETTEEKRKSNSETVLGYVVLGLFATGIVGISEASEMHRGIDVLFCLLGSIAAFGTVAWLYLGKR